MIIIFGTYVALVNVYVTKVEGLQVLPVK